MKVRNVRFEKSKVKDMDHDHETVYFAISKFIGCIAVEAVDKVPALMPDSPDIYLDHINLPALKPEWLAEWYADTFGFKAHDGFVIGPGTLIVFEKGEPLDYRGNTHFGFRCSSPEKVAEWAHKFDATLEEDETYCGFKTEDPEGNQFEVYWEER